MTWVSVDIRQHEWIHANKPLIDEDGNEYTDKVYESFDGQGGALEYHHAMDIELPHGTIEKLLGYKLTFKDGPRELINKTHYGLSVYGEESICCYSGFYHRATINHFGKLAIGFNHTGPDVYDGLCITETHATELLRQDLQPIIDFINCQGFYDVMQYKIDALISFAHSIGIDEYMHIGMTNIVRHGPKQRIIDAFMKYEHMQNEQSKHLLYSQRVSEIKMFFNEL